MTKKDKPTTELLPHESAVSHVTGKAVFIDDIPEPHGLLYGQVVFSTIAKGRIIRVESSEAWKTEGVRAIILADDIPGKNQTLGDQTLPG